MTNRIKVIANTPDAVGMRHPLDGALAAEGSLWAYDTFTLQRIHAGAIRMFHESDAAPDGVADEGSDDVGDDAGDEGGGGEAGDGPGDDGERAASPQPSRKGTKAARAAAVAANP